MADQTQANYQWFKRQLPGLVGQYCGRHALLHDQTIDSYFATSIEAIKAGMTRYGEGNFSVEPVQDSPEDLGFYSHVGSALRA